MYSNFLLYFGRDDVHLSCSTPSPIVRQKLHVFSPRLLYADEKMPANEEKINEAAADRLRAVSTPTNTWHGPPICPQEPLQLILLRKLLLFYARYVLKESCLE